MMANNKKAVCIVGDFKYLRRYYKKLTDQLTGVGNYSGDLIIITSYFTPTIFLKKNKGLNVIVIRFPKIRFDTNAEKNLTNLNTDINRHINRRFQWYKVNLFDVKLKNWNSILYLDLNMNIHFDINPIFSLLNEKQILAREDGYPSFEWSLKEQFDNTNEIYKNLQQDYDLSIKNYFQTGVILYDTKIISENTKNEIIELVNKYPITKTNEQGIMNLYFIFHKNQYKNLPINAGEYITYYYWKIKNKKIIITKARTEKEK